MIKNLARAFLKTLYRIKDRCFPSFCIENVFPYWNKIHGAIIRRSASTYAENILGHRMHLDAADSLQLSINGVYEEFEGNYLMGLIKEDDVIVDVGANIGYYTLQFARKVGPKGHVFAFEPDPENFATLTKNIKLNGYQNVTLLQKAVSDTTQKLKLYYSEDHKGDHRTYASEENRRSFEIEATSLDDYFATNPTPINLIKMDIQGFEYYALKGMREVFSKHPKLILASEFWPYGLKQAGSDPKALLELLLASGFNLFELSEAHKALLPVKPEEILSRGEPSKSIFHNLLCHRSQS